MNCRREALSKEKGGRRCTVLPCLSELLGDPVKMQILGSDPRACGELPGNLCVYEVPGDFWYRGPLTPLQCFQTRGTRQSNPQATWRTGPCSIQVFRIVGHHARVCNYMYVCVYFVHLREQKMADHRVNLSCKSVWMFWPEEYLISLNSCQFLNKCWWFHIKIRISSLSWR